ncbi:hypothetical protein [Flavobacterium sp. CS20]|jgi:hypothetical protein|uniref:hypothetical protein n=1 Tax=Flavobacterium sp. CS20 TaxID=2775246 RepID=UPI001B39DFC6|nr:hypothetical protein [Flavobacterium sp. CS20]QTY26324.1 hypothetical protein IGB25_10265 [Flavobacterium sp. CS20]
MSKLSLDALAQRADQIASEDLLNSINGGTENDCHDNDRPISDVEKEDREDGTVICDRI